MKVTTFALIAIAFVTNCDAMDYSKYKELKVGNTGLIDLYVGGVGAGFLWMQTYTNSKNVPQTYCQPNKLALTNFNYVLILDQEITELGSAIKPDWQIEYLLLMGLQKTFPCPPN